MAVRPQSDADSFGHSSITSTSTFTVCGFFRDVGSSPAGDTLLDFSNGLTTNGILLLLDSDSVLATVRVGGSPVAIPQPWQHNQWFFVAFVCRSTTDYTAYLKPLGLRGFTPAQKLNGTDTILATTQMMIGTRGGDVAPYRGFFAHAKFWATRALNEAELDKESQQRLPANLGGLYSYAPLWNGNADLAHGNNYTLGAGSVEFTTFEPPLPMTMQEPETLRLLMNAKASAAALAGRLNAKLENFWFRGQRWDSFWIDGEGFAGGTTYFQAIAGALTSSGALLREARKVLSGALSSAGGLVRQAGKILSGTLTSSGALIRQTVKLLAGTLTSSGALVGAKVALKSIAGTLTSSGDLVKLVGKPLVGTLTSAGALLKETAKLLSGTLSSSGALASAKVVLKSLAGTLTSSATLVRQTGKALAATLPSAGAVVREIRRALSGTLTSSGALGTVKTLLKSIAGTLTSSGALVRQAGKATVGTFASSGTLVRQAGKLIAGTLSGSGALASTRTFFRSVAGTLGLAGSITTDLLANLATWVGLIFDRLLRPQTPQIGGASIGVPYLGSVSLVVPSVQSFALSVPTLGGVAVSTPRASDVRLVLYGG